MSSAIVLLVRPGELVLLDTSGCVIQDIDDPNDAGLHNVTHHLSVDGVAGLVVEQKYVVGTEPIEGSTALGIDLIGMLIRSLRKVDLRASDVKETDCIASSQGTSLVGADDVVRGSSDLEREFRCWAPGAEGTNGWHGAPIPRTTRSCCQQWVRWRV